MVSRFDNVDKRFDRMDARFDRLGRKLDQFIDTQSRTNMLVERRLQGLEPPPPQISPGNRQSTICSIANPQSPIVDRAYNPLAPWEPAAV